MKYSLRSLMIVMFFAALGAAYCGHQLKTVNDRARLKSTILEIGGYTAWTKTEPPSIPWLRKSLGDAGVEQIYLPTDCTEQFRRTAKRLFPESEFPQWDDPIRGYSLESARAGWSSVPGVLNP